MNNSCSGHSYLYDVFFCCLTYWEPVFLLKQKKVARGRTTRGISGYYMKGFLGRICWWFTFGKISRNYFGNVSKKLKGS